MNCVCPGLVATAMIPSTTVEAIPKDKLTPVATVTKAIEAFLVDSSITGQAAECSGDEVHYRPPYTFVNEAARYMNDGSWMEDINRGQSQGA